MSTVLFLCTGNYYRSRHAEAVFNHLAKSAELDWRATSRGLALEFGTHNIGPMSRRALARLTDLKIAYEGELRFPASVIESDFASATLVVGLREGEHRPMMVERFPAWQDRIEYWAVHDVDFAPPEQALPEIEENVRALIARLANKASV